MRKESDKYAEFVEHPRYGRRPQFTGLNPSPLDPEVQLHWNATDHHEDASRFESITGTKWPWGDTSCYSGQARRIADTAVCADLARQSRATVPATHYFDVNAIAAIAAARSFSLPGNR